MLETLALLGRTMGFSFAAGINLYATVAILGLAKRFGWVDLPEQFRVFDNDVVIGVALVLYVIEFVADKIPWVDSMWDAVHTVIRPIGGARHRRRDARRRQPDGQGPGGAARRNARDRHTSHQGRDARGRQHQPRAVLELGAQPRRGHLRHRPVCAGAKYPVAAAIVVILGVVVMVARGSSGVDRQERPSGGWANVAAVGRGRRG